MKKTKASNNSEPKSERTILLTEHDRIEQKLEQLKQAANASDERAKAAEEKADSSYKFATDKAQTAFDAAVTKALKVRDDAKAKASKTNNAERDAISKQNGPLKRRLLFLKSEVRRDFVVCDGPLLNTARTATEIRDYRGYSSRPLRGFSERNLPEGQWVRGPQWERCRVGDELRYRRVG